MTQQPDKTFPAGMEPLGNRAFCFDCHPGVACFTKCCRNVDMFLYPHDLIRLKKRLGIGSGDLIQRHARIVPGPNPFFPSLMMRMTETEEKACPFLGEGGCTVYENRPGACRMYPLERAVDRTPSRGRPEEFYFLTSHPYCLGHQETREWTVKEWLRSQDLLYNNLMDDLWAEMDTLFRAHPWEGEGVAGPRQRMAFTVCYDIDGFRRYVTEQNLLAGFRLDKARARDVEKDDEALLKFGYDWLKFILAGQPTLRLRR